MEQSKKIKTNWNRLIADTFYEKTEKILTEKYFKEVAEFFYDACTNKKYRYKVFLTRRAYVLYRIFHTIFSERIEGYEVYGEIYNTHSLHQLIKDIKNIGEDDTCKVMIVDDIVLHGRTIRGIYKKMLHYLKEENISLWCILYNTEASINSKLFGNYRETKRDELDILSNLLTEVIVASNIGYVSFLDTFYVATSDKEIFDNNNLNYFVVDNQDELYEKNGIISKTIFLDMVEQFSDTIEKRQLSRQDFVFCVREFCGEEFTVFIPFVILPELKKRDCVAICRELLSCLHETLPDQVDANDCCSVYQWTICVLSRQIWRLYCDGMDFDYKKMTCEESFKPYDKKKDQSKNNNENLQELEDVSDDCSICDEEFDTSIMEADESKKDQNFLTYTQKEMDMILQTYLYRTRLLDEKRAKTDQERLTGIRISSIVDKLLGKKIDPEYNKNIIAVIIKNWDVGKSSYTISEKKINGEEIVVGFIRNGEQAYQLVYRLNNLVYCVFYRYFIQTGQYHFNEIWNVAMKLNKHYNTEKYLSFVDKLDQDNFYYDLLTVKPTQLNSKEERELDKIMSYIYSND